MERAEAVVHGVTSRAVNRILCGDALTATSQVTMLVAVVQGRVVGYVLAMSDDAAYWRRFWLRHPVTAVRMLCRRVVNKIVRTAATSLRPAAAAPEGILERGSGRAWNDSSPRIAKILHIAVSEPYRCRGIGAALYRRLFTALAARGIRRVDANVSFENAPSLRLHEATGWAIERTATNLFATTDLGSLRQAPVSNDVPDDVVARHPVL